MRYFLKPATRGGIRRTIQVATWLMAIARFKAISECRRRSETQLDDRTAAVIEDLSDTPSTSMEKRQRSDIPAEMPGEADPIHREVY